MQIVVVGSQPEFEEVQRKFGSAHTYRRLPEDGVAAGITPDCVVFDFLLAGNARRLPVYRKVPCAVFVHAVNRALLDLTAGDRNYPLFGFNGWPTCVERPLLETSCLNPAARPGLEATCRALETDFKVVDDRTGMVTPRIIAMIVNEAYHTVQDGTASRHDIDQAMQLGTNYPYGPFAWCSRIGIANIFNLLEALCADTHDQRYQPAPLLKKEFLIASQTAA
jgi:3-hydroxybutyryl-CoA dehydrogenase